MAEKVVNGFMKGMSKDLQYGALDVQQYIHAENFRQVSSGLNTTSSIENIRGNKFIGDNATTSSTALLDGHVYMVAAETVIYNLTSYSLYSTFTCATGTGLSFIGTGRVIDITDYNIAEDQYIIGGVELRNSIILFTTNNTNSRIYKLTLTGTSNSSIDSLDLLYDDNLNTDGSTLSFDVDYPIKAVARYETPNIQKVYWTDGLNPIRYVNVSDPCTVTGDPYNVSGDYWGVDKFEFLPKILLDKPTITGTTTGTIESGMVFYAFQLYLENGAESAISYISDPVHVVEDNDYYSSDLHYNGDGVDSIKSKGFVVNIDFSGNTTYNRLKLIRIHYSSFNQVPTINVVSDVSIDLNVITDITLTDSGSSIYEMTADEFNISFSEMFVCQELATKNNILFAGNIEKQSFTISDFDSRAVRFKSYTEDVSGTGYVLTSVVDFTPEDDGDHILTWYANPNGVHIDIYNFKEWASIPSDRTITAITGYLADTIYLQYKEGSTIYETTSSTIFITDTIWDGTNLSFIVNSADINFTIGAPVITTCILSSSVFSSRTMFSYSYTATGATTIIANVVDTNHDYGTRSILEPTDSDNLDSWDTAGWSKYFDDHDGINNYNNPDNTGDSDYEYIYQSDGSTLGAEGPNIKIGFAYEDFFIDDVATTGSTYYVGLLTGESYKNYASPLRGGKLTWQRDEVYRLFISFKNDRGQSTEPKWICDLRIPGMVGATYGLFTNRSSDSTTARRIYPTILIRDGSWPTDAVSAQVYRVPRNKEDRQVVTQAFAYPFSYYDSEWRLSRYGAVDAIDSYSTGNENIIKLVSPEINITKNISKSGNDYIEYLTNYYTDMETTGAFTDLTMRRVIKCRTNTIRSTFSTNDYSDVSDSISVVPIEGEPNPTYSVGGTTFYNYNNSDWIHAKGSTGLVVKYSNNSWTGEGKRLTLVNYKNNCWNSQYGGLTYENRQFNTMIPCSDILYDDDVTYNCEYGDTFINYFDVSTLLYDLTEAEGETREYSNNEAVYVPLESSINCNLVTSDYQMHKIYDLSYSYLVQEELGAHMFTDDVSVLRTYNQLDDMYKYNTVYSQQPLIGALLSIDETRATETVFDTQIKASNVKINGEFVDSWTRFGVNETIDVDSAYGPLNAMLEYGKSLYFWQDKAFGVLSVNDRSVIQDNNTSKLVLGTGGVLDRYDYISTQKGCEDKFSVTAGVSGIYWVDRYNKSIDRYSNSLTDLSLQKNIKSIFYLDEDLINWPKYITVQDKENNEILFTFANYESGAITAPGLTYNSLNRPFTLCFNESLDSFTSEYSFVPFIYIPYKNSFLTNTIFNNSTTSFPANLLFMHNVSDDVQARNNFYGLYYNDVLGRNQSKATVVFNPYYLSTKVFDNMFFDGEVRIGGSAVDTYKKNVNETIDNDLSPINTIKFYNSYQNTDLVTLTYKTNLERRERTWTTAVPRNDVNATYLSQSNDPQVENLTTVRTDYQERMRDKYLVCEFTSPYPTNNTNSYRVIINNLGVTYRNSYR